MTAGDLKLKLARSSEAEFVSRLHMLVATKPDHGTIKNADPEVRWKGLDLNVLDVDQDGTFDGIASGYLNLDSDSETVLPGAFDESLKAWNNPNPVVLWMHKVDTPIGFHLGPGSGNATQGLPVKAKLLKDCEPARYAHAFLRGAQNTKGARAGLSVGFRALKTIKLDGSEIRGGLRGQKYTAFERCSLLEYSVVSFPSNPEAWVTSVKSEAPAASVRSSAKELSAAQHQAAFSVLYDAAKVSEMTWEAAKNAAVNNKSLSLGQQLEMIRLAYSAKQACRRVQRIHTPQDLLEYLREITPEAA